MSLHVHEGNDRAGHPSSIAVEQLAFDDDGGQLDAATVEHIATCDRCGALVQTLREERAAFRVTHPSAAFMARLEERDDAASRPRRFRGFFSAFAVAAAVGAVALVVTHRSDGPSSPTGVKMKGATELALHVHVSRNGEPAAPFDLREELHAGDVVRFVADVPDGGYAALVSVDERQQLSWYHPTSSSPARPLAAGRSKVLPGAIQLDDYAGRELLVLIMNDTPVDRAAIEARVRRALAETKGDLITLHRRGLGARSASQLVIKGSAP